MKKCNHFFLLCVFMMFAAFVSAETVSEPQKIIQTTVDSLLSDLSKNRAEYRHNPEAFHEALHKILDPVVDVDGIARSVMTVKYSRKATAEQMNLFKTNFEKGLMQFYGNALLEYENKGIKVLRTTPTSSPDRVSVMMEIKGKSNEVYPVSYTMVKLNNQWKVRNVVINGLNIGKLFRDQFANEMKKNNDNLTKVIENWADSVKQVQESEDNK